MSASNKSINDCNLQWTICLFVTLLGLTVSFGAMAQVLQLQPSHAPDGLTKLWPHVHKIIADAESHAKVSAKTGPVWTDGRDTYKTKLNDKTYYITINGYVPLSREDRAEITDKSNKLYPGFCVFYVYNKDLQFVSSYTIKVGDGHAATNCNTILGVSGVEYHGKPALLAIAQYFYTDRKAVSSMEGIGSNWIQTAVLLPLVQQPDGKWVFIQDTTCFERTNTYQTLAKARKHLKTCGCD